MAENPALPRAITVTTTSVDTENSVNVTSTKK